MNEELLSNMFNLQDGQDCLFRNCIIIKPNKKNAIIQQIGNGFFELNVENPEKIEHLEFGRLKNLFSPNKNYIIDIYAKKIGINKIHINEIKEVVSQDKINYDLYNDFKKKNLYMFMFIGIQHINQFISSNGNFDFLFTDKTNFFELGKKRFWDSLFLKIGKEKDAFGYADKTKYFVRTRSKPKFLDNNNYLYTHNGKIFYNDKAVTYITEANKEKFNSSKSFIKIFLPKEMIESYISKIKSAVSLDSVSIEDFEKITGRTIYNYINYINLFSEFTKRLDFVYENQIFEAIEMLKLKKYDIEDLIIITLLINYIANEMNISFENQYNDFLDKIVSGISKTKIEIPKDNFISFIKKDYNMRNLKEKKVVEVVNDLYFINSNIDIYRLDKNEFINFIKSINIKYDEQK